MGCSQLSPAFSSLLWGAGELSCPQRSPLSCGVQGRSVVPGAHLSAVGCRGRSIKKRDALRLDRQGRRAGSVVDTELDSLMSVAERRILYKLMSVMDNGCH